MASENRRFSAWDVVRVDFPYADGPSSRRRPALVIATPEVQARFGILWLLMITSARHHVWPGDVRVTDLASAGLSHDCVVRTQKIATLDSRHAVRIGRLAEADHGKIVASLRNLLNDVFSH